MRGGVLSVRRGERRPWAVRSLAGGAALAAAVAAALVLLPVGEREREEREERFRTEALAALTRDARRLEAVSARVLASRGLGEIVDGGLAGVRPARLFDLLADALPSGEGWGIVFRDREGRPVAWAGAAGGVGPADARPGHRVRFSVTSFSQEVTAERAAAAENRGALTVSRRYPTGILRPDLIEELGLSGGPTPRRLRARAGGAADPVALDLEPVSREQADDDVRRARAFPWGVGAAVLCLLSAGLARAWAPGLGAARLCLLFGAPRGGSALFRVLPGGELLPDAGLLATPADLFLTGATLLLLLRIAAMREGRGDRGPVLRLLAPLGALAAALLPWLAASAGPLARAYAPGTLDLVPASSAALLAGLGATMLGAAATGLGALACASLRAGRLLVGLGIAGGAGLVASFFVPGAAGSVLSSVAAFAATLALGPRLGRFGRHDLLSRGSTVLLVTGVGAASLASGAGLSAVRDAERALVETQRSFADRERIEEEGPSAFEQRVASAALVPWLPGGDETDVTDLALALWARGATPQFPEAGDVLTVRDANGSVVSSFGLLRPGAEGRGTAVGLGLPVGRLGGVVTRVPFPRDSDRDPLLETADARGFRRGPSVERSDYDAAGRPRRVTSLDEAELDEALLAEARRAGRARGFAGRGEARRLVDVRAVPGGFEGYDVPVAVPVLGIGAAVAATERALPLVFALLLAGRGLFSRAAGGRPLATFRARLVAALLLSGALPLVAGVAVVKLALERHGVDLARRRALELLVEARRLVEPEPSGEVTPQELNRAAAVVGSDLLLYREGELAAASRALPVSAGLAPPLLPGRVASSIAGGLPSAAAVERSADGGRSVLVRAALVFGGGEVLSVVLPQEPAGSLALQALILLAVAVALVGAATGSRAALLVSRPVEELVAATKRLAEGERAVPLARPATEDLARLADAFVAMADRVTERTESLAREREAAVSLLANLTAAVVLFSERDGTVLLANEAADELLPGKSLDDRLAGSPWEPVRAALSSPRPFEARIPFSLGGREHVFRVVVASLPPDAAGPRGLLLLEDLTAFTRAERLETWVQAARAVAHDLKNPLTPIRLASERLLRLEARDGAVTASDAGQAARTILRQVAILTDRIGRLGRFASPTAPALEATGGDAWRGLLGEVAADYAGHPSVAVRVEVEDALPPVLADRVLCRDVVANFVLNAVEALEGRRGTVLLSARSGGPGRVRLACEDDGPGPAAADLEQLFDPSFSTKARGSGMGLFAARRAVEEQHGHVFAERLAGGGLAIGFVLPAANAG